MYYFFTGGDGGTLFVCLSCSPKALGTKIQKQIELYFRWDWKKE